MSARHLFVKVDGGHNNHMSTHENTVFEESEKESIIENLTNEQENILKDVHAQSYNGLDDDMPEDYESFLTELSADLLKKYLKINE